MVSTYTADRPRVSVVICAYNEQDAILPLLDATRRALAHTPHQLIVVDDGSTDQTLPRLRQRLRQSGRSAEVGEPLTVVELSRNFGQSAALAAGLAQATGHHVATLDGDGQNDPADIPHLLQLAQSTGADLVAGIRVNRQDGWLLRRLPSQWANALIRRLTGIQHPDFGCTLKLMTHELVQRLPIYGDKHRFVPALAKAEGGTMVSTPVQHHPRLTGTSKYGLGRIPRVLGDLVFFWYLLHYRNRPMHAAVRALGLWGGLALLGTLALLNATGAGLGTFLLGLAGFGLLGTLVLALGIGADLRLYERYQAGAARPYVVRQIHRPAAVGQALTAV